MGIASEASSFSVTVLKMESLARMASYCRGEMSVMVASTFFFGGMMLARWNGRAVLLWCRGTKGVGEGSGAELTTV